MALSRPNSSPSVGNSQNGASNRDFEELTGLLFGQQQPTRPGEASPTPPREPQPKSTPIPAVPRTETDPLPASIAPQHPQHPQPAPEISSQSQPGAGNQVAAPVEPRPEAAAAGLSQDPSPWLNQMPWWALAIHCMIRWKVPILLCFACVLGWFLVKGYIRREEDRRWQELVDELNSTPGIEVVSADPRKQVASLEILRDEHATDPASILEAHGFDPQTNLVIEERSYMSMDPEIVAVREERAALAALMIPEESEPIPLEAEMEPVPVEVAEAEPIVPPAEIEGPEDLVALASPFDWELEMPEGAPVILQEVPEEALEDVAPPIVFEPEFRPEDVALERETTGTVELQVEVAPETVELLAERAGLPEGVELALEDSQLVMRGEAGHRWKQVVEAEAQELGVPVVDSGKLAVAEYRDLLRLEAMIESAWVPFASGKTTLEDGGRAKLASVLEQLLEFQMVADEIEADYRLTIRTMPLIGEFEAGNEAVQGYRLNLMRQVLESAEFPMDQVVSRPYFNVPPELDGRRGVLFGVDWAVPGEKLEPLTEAVDVSELIEENLDEETVVR